MGCMMVKRAPVSQRDYGGPTIRSVFSLSEIGNETKSAKKGPRPDDTYKSDASAANRKIARYTAKIDPRVTAKYEPKAVIGKGSFSRIVRVEHRITRQPYSVKIVDRRRGKDRFDSELNVLLRIQHPYIIHLVEVFESKDKLYMVVDHATGGELLDRIIAKGSFTELDARNVLKMVIEGLRYLHSRGITHRNLKPENILYYHPGPDSQILITNFGLSAFRKKGNEFMYTICGTPEYIAPEVLAEHPYTSQVDMWAVGVISYILLSGKMPFDNENHTHLYRLILKGQYSYDGEHWNDVSFEAKNFITCLLTVDPSLRMTAIDSLQHPWLTTPPTSNKDLYGSIRKNLMDEWSTSDKSSRSKKSSKSGSLLHSEHQRVIPEAVETPPHHPEAQVERSSHLGGFTKSSIVENRTSTGGDMTNVTWSYDEDDSVPGPSRWGELIPDALGRYQSPVVIVPSEAEFNARLAADPIRVSYNDYQCHVIHNSGRSVQVTLEDEEDPKRQSKISGGPMEGEHPLRQFHFHWGQKSNVHGSEHRVPGKTYAAELHFVHWDSANYSSFAEAFQSKHGLIVLGVFIKVGEEHKSLKVLTDLFEEIPFPGDHVNIPSGFNPASLLPGDLSRYWTYSGSVTSPPCYESVRFIIFRESIEVSEDQMNAFRSLRPVPFIRQAAESLTTERRLVNNFRPTMPLNDRKIQASFRKSSRTKKSRDANKRQKV